MKLLTLLKALRPDEHRDFEKFLQSPFFKASDQYLAFFKHLCKHHPGFEVDRDELEAAYRRCFGAKSFTKTKLHNLMSGMARQVEQYLAVSGLVAKDGEPETPLCKELLAKSLGKRRMGAYFRAEAERILAAFEARPTKSQQDYLSLQALYQETYFNPDTPRHVANQPALQLAADNLDLYYCVAKLRYAAEMMARERILKNSHEMPMLHSVLEHASLPAIREKHPLVAVYGYLVGMYLEGASINGFRSVKASFMANLSELPKADLRELLTHLINCGVTLNASEQDMNGEMLELYKLAVSENMLLENGRITHVTFSNIVAVAALCKEFEWAKWFISSFATFMDPAKQKPAMALSHALVFYQQGNLDAAQTSLVAEVFQLPVFDIAARVLLLKIAFDRYLQDVSDYDFLCHSINASKKYFVGKDTLSEERRLSLLNYVKSLKQMAAAKSKAGKVTAESRKKLEDKLSSISPIVSRKWLNEAIGKL